MCCLCHLQLSLNYLIENNKTFTYSSTGHEVLCANYPLAYPLANKVAKGYINASVCPSFRPSFHNILVNTLRISILQWILTKLGTYLVIRRVWNPIDFQGHLVKFLLRNILVNTRINILQWILTKLGTYLVLRRVWNPIDFQGHRSKVNVTGSNLFHVTSL